MPVKRHKTPGKQFRHRLTRRKLSQHIPVPMLQNKNPRQRSTPRRRIHRLPMPRRPIHPHPGLLRRSVIPILLGAESFVIPSNARDLGFRQLLPCSVIPSEGAGRRSRPVPQSRDLGVAGIIGALARDSHVARLISPHNNPVITQNLHILPRRPQPRSRTLPRSRMPHKQIPAPIRPDDPATMQLNRFLLRKPVHNQQLIQRILQGSHRKISRRKALFTHLQRRPAEPTIHQQPLIRLISQNWRAEVEPKFRPVFIQLPQRTGVKQRPPRRTAEALRPFNLNRNIGNPRIRPKRFQGRNQRYIAAARSRDLNRHSTYLEFATVRSAQCSVQLRQCLPDLASHPRPGSLTSPRACN